jgi:hypothetical protein
LLRYRAVGAADAGRALVDPIVESPKTIQVTQHWPGKALEIMAERRWLGRLQICVAGLRNLKSGNFEFACSRILAFPFLITRLRQLEFERRTNAEHYVLQGL